MATTRSKSGHGCLKRHLSTTARSTITQQATFRQTVTEAECRGHRVHSGLGLFGAFYSVAVTEQHKDSDDPNIFSFSFESCGWRMTPERFVTWEGRNDKARVRFLKNKSRGCHTLGRTLRWLLAWELDVPIVRLLHVRCV